MWEFMFPFFACSSHTCALQWLALLHPGQPGDVPIIAGYLMAQVMECTRACGTVWWVEITVVIKWLPS